MPRKFKYGAPKTIVCPFCFAEVPLWGLMFGSPGGERLKAVPSAKQRVQNMLASLGFPGVEMAVPTFARDKSGTRFTDKYCPNPDCGGQALPYTTGFQNDLILGLVGGKATGKSHFVATMVDRLQTEVSTAFRAALSPINESTRQRYDDEFYNPLITGHQGIPPTPNTAPPLLYNQQFLISQKTGDRTKSVTMALYDTAGEDFSSVEDIARKTPFLSRASGLIIIIDPLQMEPVRQQMPQGIALPEMVASVAPAYILGRVLQELRTKRGVGPETMIDIPIAIVLTKADALESAGLLDQNTLWATGAQHRSVYDLQLHNNTNAMFSELVQQWDPAAWNIVKTNFRCHSFFGVSSTGCAPDDYGNYPFVSPKRVEDPALWLLYELGVIEGRQSR